MKTAVCLGENMETEELTALEGRVLLLNTSLNNLCHFLLLEQGFQRAMLSHLHVPERDMILD